MKVVVSDFFPESAVERLRHEGIECHYDHTLKGPDLRALLSEEQPQVLLVRTTRVTADIINAANSLELVVRAGTGCDGIDSAEANRRGVFIAHCPGKSAIAVAELVLGLICAADRRILENVSMIREGKWNKGHQTDGLHGKVLGIVGLGDIGLEVATRAKAFGLRILGYDPQLSQRQTEELGIEYRDSLASLAPEANILTFHVPTIPQTKFMLTPAVLSSCRSDALLVNTSRWDIVSEDDLLVALESKPGLRYTCDCYRYEPSEASTEFRNKLVTHPRVYGTSHISSYTLQAEQAFTDEAIRIILKYAVTKQIDPRNCANRTRKTPANYTLTIRARNEPGILAFAVSKLTDAGCQVQEVENVVFKDAVACRASVDFLVTDLREMDRVIEEVKARPGIVNAEYFPKAEEEEALVSDNS